MDAVIEVAGLSKTFGSVAALDDVSLSVRKGSVLGLLGHNGAGKTTLVNILSTLLRPSRGRARVAGFDVVGDGVEVRRRIGLTGQYAAVDETLSGRDNLILIARLLGAGRADASARADELLEIFQLSDAARRRAKTYSGGMRRRLDLAASLVGRPDVLFLDEPTTGLDPVARRGLWQVVERLVEDGATVLLTTQYLDEADYLADSITVLAEGRIVASGTAAELKERAGSRNVSVTLRTDEAVLRTTEVLRRSGLDPAPAPGDEDGLVLVVPVRDSTEIATVVRATDEAGAEIAGLAYAEPTLDDVYMALNHSSAVR
ncbi:MULTISPECIES: daunorubicin resistance protein DrrA family ABC transporter ATP-binding protein [Streptomyces]|uniref:daunorubicin resistance protein DrrA family ABC transporter ATP-binding protein n=1 Tax=Streptomyces TaxID=1883 RepID=UPI0005158664|nr:MULTISPECIES: daunorubicin resistance protein DrrA family ABC transporter ATP-binding protein [Streptomyces]MCX4489700.1 daunorubicin resistance protein DrrA family ABC transporter ATP-binding protein [Streptomyces anulatus]MCX4504243.1 daunorubicin resistance protein DrrA family ABC transporter ATP-binding protein [Streptomyces anulatus]MCX4520075.1 daunorubicin resistance protein DrrA family ABC transporter ATP-binding protein [Streptomyces anulatus]MCX4602945.1 daunorubicin resistance pro